MWQHHRLILAAEADAALRQNQLLPSQRQQQMMCLMNQNLHDLRVENAEAVQMKPKQWQEHLSLRQLQSQLTELGHTQLDVSKKPQSLASTGKAKRIRDRVQNRIRGYNKLGSQGIHGTQALYDAVAPAFTDQCQKEQYHSAEPLIDQQPTAADIMQCFEPRVRDRSDQYRVQGYSLHGAQGISNVIHNSAGFPIGRLDHECFFVDDGLMWHKGFSDDDFPFKVIHRDGSAKTKMDGTVTHAVKNNPKYDTLFDPNVHPIEFTPIHGSNPLMYSYNSVRGYVPGDQHSGQHYIGACDRECVHCHAMLWPGEPVGQCCAHGRVYVAPISHPFPPRLMELFTGISCMPLSNDLLRQLKRDHTLFMAQFRVINANLSFASFNTTLITVPGNGPPLFKVSGLVTCSISSPAVRKPKNGTICKPPVFSQLYFVDIVSAKQVLAQNKACKESNALYLINEIHALLRSKDVHNSRGILAPINAIAELIMSMKEVEEEHLAQGKAIPTVKINFNTGKNINLKTHNAPSRAINDVGGLIVGEGLGTKMPGLCIRNKASDNWSHLRLYDPYSDALNYPLFNPRGDSGWHLEYMGRSTDVEQPSEQVLLEMEIDGLKSDALLSQVDGQSVVPIKPGDHADDWAHGEGATAATPASNAGSPPGQDEEGAYDDQDCGADDEQGGPSKEEEQMAAEAMASYECDNDGYDGGHHAMQASGGHNGCISVGDAGVVTGVDNQLVDGSFAARPSSPGLMGSAHPGLGEQEMDVEWAEPLGFFPGGDDLPDCTGPALQFPVSDAPLFPASNLFSPGKAGTRSGPSRKAHTKRQQVDDGDDDDVGQPSMGPTCGRRSDPTWVDKVQTIFGFSMEDSELNSEEDADFVPSVSKKQRRSSAGNIAPDSDEDPSTEDSDTASEDSWEAGTFDGDYFSQDQEDLGRQQQRRWDDGPTSFVDDMAEVSSEDEAQACEEDEHGAKKTKKGDKKVTLAEYYRYLLHHRHPVRAPFSPLHYGRMGWQQWLTHAGIKVEDRRLAYVGSEHGQKQHRVETYTGLRDHVENIAKQKGLSAGRRVILPSSYEGSPRNIAQRYQDAMSICRATAPPDLFVTITANNLWQEIKENLHAGQDSCDRNELIHRVFRLKLKAILDEIIDKRLFGTVSGFAMTIEYQKRGLPHAHALVILDQGHAHGKPRTASVVDRMVSAELPPIRVRSAWTGSDGTVHPEMLIRDEELYNVIKHKMIHGPCNLEKYNYLACRNSKKHPGACSQGFPMPPKEETYVDTDGYPTYRKRADVPLNDPQGRGRQTKLQFKKYPPIDNPNGWVVSHNPYLSKRYNCHINVQISTSIKSFKYVFKYVYKGPDQAEVETILTDKDGKKIGGTLDHDEVQTFVLARYLSSCEAVSRIMGACLQMVSHLIVRLAVHLPLQHRVKFVEGQEEEALAKDLHSTTLTSFFDLNKGLGVTEAARDRARSMLYADIHTAFVMQDKTKLWVLRKSPDKIPDVSSHRTSHVPVIGRMYSVSPNDVEFERYCVRLLLLHVKGPTSFVHLRTSEDGLTVHDTFLKAAIDRGLLDDDKEWDRALTEARQHKFPSQMRELFGLILMHCTPTDPLKLWLDHKRYLWNDRQTDAEYEANESQCDFMAYHKVQDYIQQIRVGFTLQKHFRIPEPLGAFPTRATPLAEKSLGRAEHASKGAEMYKTLTQEQRAIVDEILVSERQGLGQSFFLSGQGGSGKTYLYTCLYHIVMGEQAVEDLEKGDDVYAMASTGIAAILLPGGVTCHKRIGCPLDTDAPAMSIFSTQSIAARQLARCKLFIFDEATMSHRCNIECMDSSLQDFRKDERPFGGATVVFGGDFRQTLPVVIRGTAANQVAACIRMSYLWAHIKCVELKRNIRVNSDAESQEYAQWVLDVGNGVDKSDTTTFPRRVDLVHHHLDLIERIFGQDINKESIAQNFSRAIVSPTNKNTRAFNEIIINDLMPGEALECESVDRVAKEASKDPCFLSPEFLNKLHPPGLPPSKLFIKVGAIYMLIRSLNVDKGLCNGTRFVVHNCDNKFMLVCRHIAGIREGELFYLPRLLLSPTAKYPFAFQRRQFPCIPAFAITINKCQGSTFQELGVDLTSDVFSHGQAYVAYSRVRGWSHLHVLLPKGATSARNVVSREVLDMAFHNSTPRPTSFHPESATSHQHWHTEADADHDEEALADNYDVLQDVHEVHDEYAGHFCADDGNHIDWEAESEEEDNAGVEVSVPGQTSAGEEVMEVDAGAAAGAVPAGSVPQCMAQAQPYVIEGYMIDHKARFPVASGGHLTLQPGSYLTIQENKNSWYLEINSPIAAMRLHNIAFRADLATFGCLQEHPVRWTGKSAEYIRPVLAREYLLLTRDQQLRLANHAAAAAVASSSTGRGETVLTVEQEDVCIAKFAHDIGTVGTFMPTAVFWLISQICVVSSNLKGKNMNWKAGARWSPFSVCIFEIDSDSLAPGNIEVTVSSNNVLDWTALVHNRDNADLSLVTLAYVLLNGQYYAAEILPKQIAGAKLQHQVILFAVNVCQCVWVCAPTLYCCCT
jgi:hypothetical protein